MEQGDEVFPIEVKSSSNIRARSLSYVCNRYGLHGIRIGEIGYRKQSWLTNIPLWCVDGLGEYLKRQIEKSRPKRNRSPARGRGDAGHETVEEFRHVDAQCDLGVFVGILEP